MKILYDPLRQADRRNPFSGLAGHATSPVLYGFFAADHCARGSKEEDWDTGDWYWPDVVLAVSQDSECIYTEFWFSIPWVGPLVAAAVADLLKDVDLLIVAEERIRNSFTRLPVEEGASIAQVLKDEAA